MFFQDIIQNLNNFWSEEGCLIMQPYDTEKGAGTMNPHTFLRAIGPEPWNVAYAEPCRRPTDGRFGDNPNRAQHYFQYQVIIKPSPEGIQEKYLTSLESLHGDGGVFLKANQKTGNVFVRSENGLGEGILITSQYEEDAKESDTFGPLPLDFFI